MKFTSANPSVVRSVKQRDLLNAWLRALRSSGALPLLTDYRPERVADELVDMMGYDVEGDGGRRPVSDHSARLAAKHDLRQRAHRAAPANQPLSRRCDRPGTLCARGPCLSCLPGAQAADPTISTVRDDDGKEVSYERLLLPFGSAGKVEQLVGSFKAISIEGRFKIANLMGLRSGAKPVSVINAVIDLDFVRVGIPAGSASDEVIEQG
jgi:hypothetical protein